MNKDSTAACLPADLHVAHILLPLLTFALSSARYRQLGKWQKRVAWRVAQKLAAVLCDVLPRPPVPTPSVMGAAASQNIRLSAGHPMTLLGLSHDGSRLEQKRILTDHVSERITHDECVHEVLPWQAR